jgi:hypothetical protein
MHHLQNILEMWKTHSVQNQVIVSIDQNLKTCIPFASIRTHTTQTQQKKKLMLDLFSLSDDQNQRYLS